MTAARKHEITPTDKAPRPDKHGLYAAADFYRGSNPHWDSPTPVRHSADQRIALICGGLVWDAAQLGRKA